ncbi:hypothetical protein ABZ559_01780 [Streptococcus sp. ZY19097]|uniref:hypothetical protein n=1 Tax=Streptococcus sp. ZY19097 TaxID=3231906 RepID=UPI003457552A
MKLKNFLSVILVITLGGLIIMTLSACGLNKDSREWIEKNRISDIYKVYPTKNPEDLFNIFTKGFNIEQYYKDEHNNEYKMHFTGNSDTKTINGELIKYYGDEEKKLADVSYRDGHLVFSDSSVKQYWPLDGFLFQHLTIDQAYLDKLKEKEHSYNVQSGTFSISYEIQDSPVKHLLHKEKVHITDFKISGYGNNYKYYYARTLKFKFNDSSVFSESINKLYD